MWRTLTADGETDRFEAWQADVLRPRPGAYSERRSTAPPPETRQPFQLAMAVAAADEREAAG